MTYNKNTVYILGTAKIGKTDPIAALYEVFFTGLVLESETGKIIDSTCNMVSGMTTDFVKSILVGYHLENDIEAIEAEIKARFHGMAQKSVIASVKDARNKYIMLLNAQEK